MDKILVDRETQIEISHSKLGIISFILSFLLCSYLSALYLITVEYNNLKFKTFDSDLIFSQALKIPLNISIYLAASGIVLSIIGLLSKYRRKFYPLIGFIFNVSILYFSFQFFKILHLN